MPAPVVYLTAVRAARHAAGDRRLRWAVVAAAVAAGTALVLAVVPFLAFVSMEPPPVEEKPATAPTGGVYGPPVAGIPAVSYAALVQASQGSLQVAGCFVSVPLLGGVMGVESGYGTFGGSQPDPATGDVRPPIYGPELAPGSGFEVIPNDDYGRSLGVTTPYAKAVGPTQFLPSTWRYLGRDGNGDGVADPQNIYDAAMSTAAYLCAHGYVDGDQAKTRLAIWHYNPSFTYVALVLERAAALAVQLTVAPPPGPPPGLTTVRGITVATRIAGQLEAMLAAAEQDGIRLGGYGWRSYQTQVDLRRENCGASHYDIYERPSGECDPPTAIPGRSNHEDGLAIDFNANGVTITRGGRAYAWLAANAPRFGFYPCTCGEAWHWSVDAR